MNRLSQFVLGCREWLAGTGEDKPSTTRMALAGAVLLALAHYAFGEWVFHPDVALWQERVFWTAMPWAAAVPVLGWLAWVVISAGRVNATRALLLMFVVVFAGDWAWYQVWRYLPEFGAKASEDYWYWWTHWLLAALVLGNGLIARRWWTQISSRAVVREKRQFTLLNASLRVVAFCLGGWVLLLVLVHLVVPQLSASDFTLDVANEFLVRPEWRSDFAFVMQHSPCRGKRLGALLEHMELANSQRKQFYNALDDATFQQWVLAPVVDTMPIAELEWRRTLWEAFYPCVRRENEPSRAARIVVRALRERVGISSGYPYRVGVETIWTQGMTDEAGFERIYVAALRSVGIAARLSNGKQTEFLVEGNWQLAPRPLLTSW